MSCLLAALTLTLPARAHAVDLAVRPPDDLDARHRFGLQLGGSAVFQLVYRLRLLGHSYLEVGGAGAPEATLNGSAGLVFAYSTGRSVFPYVGAGVGFASSAGQAPTDAATTLTCEHGTAGCPWRSAALAYGYGRVGVGVTVLRNASINLDVGFWRGERSRSFDDGHGTLTASSSRFLWPMAGLSFLGSI